MWLIQLYSLGGGVGDGRGALMQVAGRTDQLDELLKQFLDQSGGGGYGDDDVILADSPAPAPQFKAKAAFLPTGMPLAEQSLVGKSNWLGL
jgi:hypothetical protein